MDTTTVIGVLAAVASTTSFAPQAWKIIKSRDTSGVSSSTYAVTVVGFSLWLLYGQQLHSWPLIVTNSICLAFSGFIFIMTVLPQNQKEAVADEIEDNVPVR